MVQDFWISRRPCRAAEGLGFRGLRGLRLCGEGVMCCWGEYQKINFIEFDR
jgi:hypothetical protein